MASIKQNTVYNTLLSILNVLFPFITAPYISRVLGVENVGIVNFATSYAAYFALFATLGVPRYGIRAIAEKGDDTEARNKTFSELFWLISLSSIIVTLVYVISIFTVEKLYEERIFLLIGGLTVITASFNIEWYFSGRENFKLITIRSLVVRVISIVGLFVFVRNSEDVAPYMLISSAGILVSQFWNWGYFFKKDFGRVKFTNLNFTPHFKPLFTLFAVAISVSIFTILDTLMLGFISTFEQVGYYTQAIRISKITIPVVTAMGPVVLARVSKLNATNDTDQIKEIVSNSFHYMLTLAIPLSVGLFFIAPYFVPLFFGEDFLPSVILVQILSPLLLIMGIGNVYITQLLQPLGYDKLFLRVVLLGTITNFILNLILIKLLGAMGASIASVAGELVVAISAFIVSFNIMRLKYNLRAIIQPIISILPIGLVFYVVKDVGISDFTKLSIIIISSILLYPVMMICVLKNEIANKILSNIFCKLGIK